jgi:hypothetical protein
MMLRACSSVTVVCGRGASAMSSYTEPQPSSAPWVVVTA